MWIANSCHYHCTTYLDHTIMQKLRIIVGGFIGLFPTGGATIDYIQYPLGLQRLGHDVYYIEDTGLYPVYQQKEDSWGDAGECITYLKGAMEFFGMMDRWAYRDVVSGKCFGITETRLKEICATADVFINISCSTIMRDEYLKIPHRILVDSDPMFTQIQVDQELNNLATTSTHRLLKEHNYLFTFGENIGKPGCSIPTSGYNWIPTRQPICMHLWKEPSTPKYGFTSVLNWSGREKLQYNNEEWGQKDVSFAKFITLPGKVKNAEFEMVMNAPLQPEVNFDLSTLANNGWKVMNPKQMVPGYKEYMDFIMSSFAEFSIAKDTYVKSGSGWFSCRSACYLASGRPVAAQDTGWTGYIPAGKGLLALSDMQSAVASVNEITANYSIHSKTAREIAAAYFDSDIVLNSMLNKLN